MRKPLILFPLLLAGSPALAQVVPAPQPGGIQLPHELTDPATVDKVARTVQALSTAVLNIRVGQVRAAVEGRDTTPAERTMTVGDVVRRHDPNFDRDIQRQVASAGPKIRQGIQALNRAVPQLSRDIADIRRSVERAAANMPDPDYPRR